MLLALLWVPSAALIAGIQSERDDLLQVVAWVQAWLAIGGLVVALVALRRAKRGAAQRARSALTVFAGMFAAGFLTVLLIHW
ncbi:hypothetical protein GKE82_26195 [Conexibacter sp. W3-3-2]|uniref:hypothetical protein n=1 Tax=Conexibacter sp. W3-3-2 TaxID=2675227 RepID=UPI0012B7761A|nr:hypothetical protein [Conexibacter sp. W3-3-2]MTD47612.1 hypothetical protein [Conexibacter sp. W3-3-2]MTD47697.1 hypothetical protein [Conexibacter sp. W3-3-2]